MPIIKVITQTYQHTSENVSASKTLNWYPEEVMNDSKGAARVDYVLMPTPGTEVFSDLDAIAPNTNCRGLHYTSTSRLFGVYGPYLIETDPNGIATLKSSGLGTLTSVVSMADNGTQLVLADGQNLYVFDLKLNTLSTPTLPFTNPIQVMFTASRFLAINNGVDSGDATISTKNRYYFSDLNDAGSWPGLGFASAELSGDNIISMALRQGQVWFFGPRSFEVWAVVSNPKLPFNRVDGSASEIGCGAAKSVASISDNVFWLGSSKAGRNNIFTSDGYTPVRISNHALEADLNKSGDRTGDAVAFAYQEEGHIFYVLSLITINKTWVYDLLTGMWHERGTRQPLLNKIDRWEPVFAVYAFEKIVVGDSKNSKILSLNLRKYQEWDGRPIVRIHRTPAYWEGLKNMVHHRFQIDMETGVGLQNGQGSDPKIMLESSSDWGHTFGSIMKTSVGKIGDYRRRAIFRRLGMTYGRVYQITYSEPTKAILIGGKIEVEVSSAP